MLKVERVSLKEIADILNVSIARPYYIATGKAWVHITGGVVCRRQRSRLSKEEVLEIKELLKQNIPYKEIAEKFDVSADTVGNIKRGVVWKNIN